MTYAVGTSWGREAVFGWVNSRAAHEQHFSYPEKWDKLVLSVPRSLVIAALRSVEGAIDPQSNVQVSFRFDDGASTIEFEAVNAKVGSRLKSVPVPVAVKPGSDVRGFHKMVMFKQMVALFQGATNPDLELRIAFHESVKNEGGVFLATIDAFSFLDDGSIIPASPEACDVPGARLCRVTRFAVGESPRT